MTISIQHRYLSLQPNAILVFAKNYPTAEEALLSFLKRHHSKAFFDFACFEKNSTQLTLYPLLKYHAYPFTVLLPTTYAHRFIVHIDHTSLHQGLPSLEPHLDSQIFLLNARKSYYALPNSKTPTLAHFVNSAESHALSDCFPINYHWLKYWYELLDVNHLTLLNVFKFHLASSYFNYC